VSVTADQIKQLREQTGAGFRIAATRWRNQGNLAQAAEWLHAQGLAAASKRSGRQAQRVLELYQHGEGRVGVMVEVNCETDFVGRTKEFRDFAHEIALQVAAAAPRWVAPDDVPMPEVERESEEARRTAGTDGKPETAIEQIIAGRLERFYAETCLLRQAYIR
jgi:elongation factor Ts